MDICPERMEYSDFVLQTDSAEAAVDICPERMDAAVDICPERMDAADAEASRPLRIETVVEFCPRVAVESMETAVETEVDVCPEVEF